MGGSEILLILLVILILFGADKLPHFARTLGKGMQEMKKATDDIKKELLESTNDIKDSFTDIKKEIKSSEDEIKKMSDDSIKG